ncbi:TPA: IS66 family insertion sequence element accessory protein TnpB [Vibrio parahaemolyticus]|uniref:IS66 family insertion sequence element accessory protein TnpA n=1 Tax=Vibrio parahaemolyticus TaxID=670 RepID=UPI001123D537|nr:IS66 family insertion sequence element accessory protein TnpB [Vibrio parahaemolyticus]EHW0638795.1 IS66 family insertion sequence element accessory protein TnpB [Vibrio parahaemolyticus]EHZ2737741.1 IS66 family insertion sequence element accessory protein TnpB [Vibrio parahaemolyticus]EKA7411177.1 IS66 family insertion sequence element accessory protein TnpB [Vibrio parahaemolyticus]MBE4181130.1 IS66 family insertion sequence element accessory protein TnpB [Vibrio parahaemolyticus]MBE51874
MSQHRSQQEWLRFVQLFYNSGLSAAQFCLEHNLHPKTFDNNLRKLRCLVNIPKNSNTPADSKFFTIETPKHQESEVPPSLRQPVRVVSTPLKIDAGAYQLQLPLEVSPHWLAQLLKELAA